MNGESEDPKPQVREYAGPTILVGIVIMAGLGVGLIWGLDPRWLFSAAVVVVVALVLAAAGDGRRREKAFQAARKARDEAERAALDGPFDQAVHEFGKLPKYPSPADWERIRGTDYS